MITIEQLPKEAILIQDQSTVDYFNGLYGQDFVYWFILNHDGDIYALWGSYSCKLDKHAFPIDPRNY